MSSVQNSGFLGISTTGPAAPGSVRWFLLHSPLYSRGGRFDLKAMHQVYVSACRAHAAEGVEALNWVAFGKALAPHIIKSSKPPGRGVCVTLHPNGRLAAEGNALDTAGLVASGLLFAISLPALCLAVAAHVGWL